MELYNKDCIEGIKKLPPKSIDFIFCDLPYGTGAKIKCKWNVSLDMKVLCKELWRVAKDEAPIVFTCNLRFLLKIMEHMGEKHFKFDVVWEKSNSTNPYLSKKRVMHRHEYIIFFYKKQPQVYTRNIERYHSEKIPQKRYVRNNGSMYQSNKDNTPDTTYDYKVRLPKSIQKFVAWNQKRINVTQKPIELCEWLLKYWTEKGMTVLDPTFGSGSMIIASVKMGRKFIGYEKDKEQWDKTLKRLKENEIYIL